MKKLFIALPFVVGAAAIAGTSQYAGTQTKSEYYELLAQLNGLSPLVFVNEEYHSGLGKSSAVTKVLASRTANAEVLFRLQHDIQHAPVRLNEDGMNVGIVSIDTRLHDDTRLPPGLTAMFTEETPFLWTKKVTFNGKITSKISISGLESAEDGESLSWSGMTFNAVTKGAATVGSGSMGRLDFTDENAGGSVSVAASPFEIDVVDHGDGVYTGVVDVAFKNVSLSGPHMPMPVSIANVELISETDMQGDVLNSNALFNLNGIESLWPVDNLSLDTQLDGIQVEGWREYKRVTMKALYDMESMMVDPDMASEIASSFLAMISPGSSLKYTLALDNGDGDVNADIRLAVKDASVEGMSADALKNLVTPRDLLNILILEGAFNADRAALSKTPVMMMLGGAGEYISVTDESVTSHLRLDGMTLDVNGVELALDMMLGQILDVPFAELASM